jgi:hypothetical protein
MATRKATARKGTSRKPTTKGKTVSLSVVVARHAEQRGIDTTKAGKAIRSRLRSHYDDYSKRFNYPQGKDNRDGNRWPDMPIALAKELLTK